MFQTSFLGRSAGGNFGQFGVAWHAVNFNCVTVSLNRSVGEVFFACSTIAICTDNSDESGGHGSSTNDMIQNNRK